MHGGCVATIIDICSSFAILVFEGMCVVRSIECHFFFLTQHDRQTQVEIDWCLD